MNNMIVFKFGAWRVYADGNKELLPAENACYMWYAQMWENIYFHTREEAEKELARTKQEAEKGLADKTAPEYERRSEMWKFALTMEVVETSHAATVSRLNTLPGENTAEGRRMREEIADVMACYGECEVSWNCFGHTRACWQTEAVCDWVRIAHEEWIAENKGSYCVIKVRN